MWEGDGRMAVYRTESPAQTAALGEQFARKLHGGEVIAFRGGMGMGKTVFTSGVARALGVEKGVASPTFTIVREYDGRIPIYHFDLYRITSFEDLYSCGFFDYLGGDGIVLIEWSENFSDYLPDNTVFVTFSRGSRENERIIEISPFETLQSLECM